MINPDFYNSNNLVHQYLGGKIAHYPIKDRSIIKDSYVYTLKKNEDVFSLAAKIFDTELQSYWTYISDCNPIRHPDDWSMGEKIKIPKIIIRDNDTNSFLNRLTLWQ
jgi:AAA+ ATPase superfamily predicted ATPase